MKDFLIDFEALGGAPDGVLIDAAVIVFEADPDPMNIPTFNELLQTGKQFKFNIAKQRGLRVIDEPTTRFWKAQSPEAKACLKPGVTDIDVTLFPELLNNFLNEQGFNKKTGLAWCRGQSYDFGMLTDLVRQVHKTRDTFNLEPVYFWNQRDVRTHIEANLKRGVTSCPLPKGTLDGFILHNSLHDCAKAILELYYSRGYAHGTIEYPTEIDPLSICKK